MKDEISISVEEYRILFEAYLELTFIKKKVKNSDYITDRDIRFLLEVDEKKEEING